MEEKEGGLSGSQCQGFKELASAHRQRSCEADSCLVSWGEEVGSARRGCQQRLKTHTLTQPRQRLVGEREKWTKSEIDEGAGIQSRLTHCGVEGGRKPE